MVSLEEDDLLVFNYLCASEIWSDKRGERGLIRGVVSLEEEDLLVFNYLSMHLKSGLIRGGREAL